METEQQEEHAAIMQNNPATPASLSALEKMPAEIILMVGAEVSPSDFMVATLVSKRLRSVLLHRRFKNLTFSGSLKKLAHDMRSFLSGEFKNLMMTILSTLKSVTIRFEPYSRAEKSTDLHLSTYRIVVIGEFVSKLSSIDLISFNNQIKDDIDFTEAFRSTPKWNGPKAVIFCGRRNFLIFSALINQFAPNTVKAVQLPRQTASRHPLALKSAFPLLKGLMVDVSSLKSRSRTLACMSSNILQRMNEYFPHLEALILYQVDIVACLSGSLRICKGLHLLNLNEYVERLITQLKSMPRLRRFAFTIEEESLRLEYDCHLFDRLASSSGGDESGDPMQATPELNQWPYWLPTYAQKDLWWSELITRILKAVPQLKELCIVHSPLEYHQGTKTEGIVTVREEEIACSDNSSQFPYILVDID
ncbi:uncharacterized protein FSUBG_4507 [Fusarium subglutinans]|uniref:F-box domain-containing protein n=1 Tax=Gibberella subglutinans TaxID=42677 RepID=A0A8H5Q5E8_GIBSU|nr:uncharacterized protein FSUBG_4507 [Fusarium subglutinans]KAF5608579.1 hypothetical protein FSUBG_4507 [Fusarium subglutinans]